MLRQIQKQPALSVLKRWKSSNFHRPDNAGSSSAVDAADATPTILSDTLDFRKRLVVDNGESKQNPNTVTWMDALNERKKQLAEGKVLDSYAYRSPITSSVEDKTRKSSFSFLTLPFKDDIWLRDAYMNAFGRLRVGQLMQDLDALAGRIAYRHCAPAEPVNVTASVDRIYMVKKVDEIQKYNFVLAGAVTWTGRSSMEISVKGFAFEGATPSDINESSLPDENVFLTANFTFVARNPETHKSFPINRLLPTTEAEWIEFRRAESHNAAKKLRAKLETLEKVPPTKEESLILHTLWSASQNLTVSNKPRNIVFMKDTKMASTLFMQPQYRNRHSYMIFGGYLMRQTFELAYCAAAAFSHGPPRFVSLDSTAFKAPVPVGSVLYMDASVSYTEHVHEPNESSNTANEIASVLTALDAPSAHKLSQNETDFVSSPGSIVQVKVDTTIRGIDNDDMKPSGAFVYSFFVARDNDGVHDSPGYCSVLPQTYSEMMEYVEGRRRAIDTARYAEMLRK